MLKSVEQVVDAIGGSHEAAKLARVGASAVSNWKARGRIPAGLSMVFSRALERERLSVDPSVFGMRDVGTRK